MGIITGLSVKTPPNTLFLLTCKVHHVLLPGTDGIHLLVLDQLLFLVLSFFYQDRVSYDETRVPVDIFKSLLVQLLY